MPAKQSGSVLVRWELTSNGVVLKPFYSSPESAPTFRRITELLKSRGGSSHLHADLTADGGILLSNLLLREPKHCAQCGGQMLGPEGLSVCGSCHHVALPSEAKLDSSSGPDTQSCPECGAKMVWRGVATVCTNCGHSTCPC